MNATRLFSLLKQDPHASDRNEVHSSHNDVHRMHCQRTLTHRLVPLKNPNRLCTTMFVTGGLVGHRPAHVHTWCWWPSRKCNGRMKSIPLQSQSTTDRFLWGMERNQAGRTHASTATSAHRYRMFPCFSRHLHTFVEGRLHHPTTESIDANLHSPTRLKQTETKRTTIH